jgi:hypothetical protein
MKFIELKWSDITIGTNGESGPYAIVFITDEMFQASLLNSLGYNLKIDLLEEHNGNVILTIHMLDTSEYTIYDTNKTIINYPLLIELKNHNVVYYTVGHIQEGNVLFHLPLRSLGI